MTIEPVGMRSLAVSFPQIIRDNDYYREHYPDLLAKAENKGLARAFSSPPTPPPVSLEAEVWLEEMEPYLKDPFRGTVERRVLGPGESALTLQRRAACDALAAAKLAPADIELMIVVSLFPDQLVPGDAAFLARDLGISAAAWNLESTCSSAVIALQTACALIRAREYRNALIVVSNTYSNFTDDQDTLMLLAADGVAAFVVGPLDKDQGLLATKVVNTSSSCGAIFVEHVVDVQGRPRAFIRAGKGATRMFIDTTRFARICCEAAVSAAGVSLNEIDFFVFSSPTPWSTRVFVRLLGIDPERTINTNHRYGNIGPVLPLINLYHAAEQGKLQENSLVLLYGIGSSSNAAASVMRWGDVALGPAPERTSVDGPAYR